MEELNVKLELQQLKLQFADCDNWDNFIAQNNDYIDQITNTKHCRKCRNCGKSGQVALNHHRNVVWNTEVGLAKSDKHRRRRPCKYAIFQEWLDFLAAHKEMLVEWTLFHNQLKETLETISSTDFLLPPFDWHYWQFFQSHLPLIHFETSVVTADQSVKPAKEAEPAKEEPDKEEYEGEEKKDEPDQVVADVETGDEPGSENHCRDFLVFFIRFFMDEYDIDQVDDSIRDITWHSDLIMDLYMDPLGLINLGEEIGKKYPEVVKQRFNEAMVPFEFLFQKMTISDLYENLFTQ